MENEGIVCFCSFYFKYMVFIEHAAFCVDNISFTGMIMNFYLRWLRGYFCGPKGIFKHSSVLKL